MGQISQSKITKLLCFLIWTYQYLISPILGPRCRFYPSCSTYAYEAISYHGSMRGLWFTFKRLLRCHPWHPGGYDPVINSNEETH